MAGHLSINDSTTKMHHRDICPGNRLVVLCKRCDLSLLAFTKRFTARISNLLPPIHLRLSSILVSSVQVCLDH
jgi:hypothetical protein